jgi:primosomal protein N' (replication factor Y)
MFDDGDPNLQDQQSPYAHARDVALLRQQIENCDVFFTAHSRSCEVQRLIDMKYLVDEEPTFKTPAVAFDDSESRVPTLAWQTIREASANGPVLVQVAAKGTARTAYCQGCSTRSLCKSCKGPIWIDATGMPRCRWCNLQNLDYKCVSCGDTKIRQGFGGSTRTVSEFGKAFPGVAIVESTGDKPTLEISPGKKIVIATPGAEPTVMGGYASVVILDANQVLLKDSLRATEEGVRVWSNAIAKMATNGRAVIAGLPQQLGQRFALWQQVEIARHELENRRELEFPPHIRLASIEGPIESITKISDAIKIEGAQVLGPISLRGSNGEQNQRFVVKYPYGLGGEVASAIKSAILSLAAGATKTSETGRVSRAIRVRMDDPEVI